jgi:Skp family chaperone for outer membrane proteins
MKSVASTYERKIKNVERKMMKIDKELRSSVVSKDVKVKKISELQKLQQQRIKLLQEYQKKKAQLERNLLLKIGKVIKEYAEKNKFDLILTGGLERGILFYSNRIDITRDVLNYVNKKLR